MLPVRSQATAPRLRRAGMGMLLVGLLGAGAGCSGGGADGAEEPTPSLSLGASSGSASAGPADDEAALRRLVKTYERVDAKADQADNTDPSVYDGILSPDYAELLVDNTKKNILDQDLHILGQYHYRVESVDVEGDQAKLQVCTDGREFFVVPKSQKQVGTGDRGQPSLLATFAAERADDGWVLTGVDQKDTPC